MYSHLHTFLFSLKSSPSNWYTDPVGASSVKLRSWLSPSWLSFSLLSAVLFSPWQDVTKKMWSQGTTTNRQKSVRGIQETFHHLMVCENRALALFTNWCTKKWYLYTVYRKLIKFGSAAPKIGSQNICTCIQCLQPQALSVLSQEWMNDYRVPTCICTTITVILESLV